MCVGEPLMTVVLMGKGAFNVDPVLIDGTPAVTPAKAGVP